MIMKHRLAVATAVAALCAANAFAAGDKIVLASLGDVQGKVLINKGQGFVAARPGMEVRTGDRIIALDDASAKVTFSDGCVTDLKENNLLAIDGKGCNTKPINPRANGNIKLAAAVGDGASDVGGGTGGGGGGGIGGGAGGLGGLGTTGMILGGVAIVGGVAIIANSNDNKNASGQ